MIKSELSLGGSLEINGSIAEVESEIVMILREIYKQQKEKHGGPIAQAIILNLVVKAIQSAGDKI